MIGTTNLGAGVGVLELPPLDQDSRLKQTHYPFPREHGPDNGERSLVLRPRRLRVLIPANTTLDAIARAENGTEWRSLYIDNFTNQYLFLLEAQQFIGPWVRGAIIPLPGNSMLTFRWQAPNGITLATFSGANAVGAYALLFENDYPPQAGIVWQDL